MLRIELDSSEQLMRLYQVIMAGKFSDTAGELLADKALADAANILVDRLIGEARTAENHPMVDMMEEMRQLRAEYPQYARIVEHFAADAQWNEHAEDYQRALIRYAAAPLVVDESLMNDLCLTIGNRSNDLMQEPRVQA